MAATTLCDDLDDAIHLAVCQAIGLDIDDIEEREREVKAMLLEAIQAVILRAKPADVPITSEFDTGSRLHNKVVAKYYANLKRELGMEDDGMAN
jgi:hypothetical protein